MSEPDEFEKIVEQVIADLPEWPQDRAEDAVVAVERLCGMLPELPGQLSGAAGHPAGRGARAFREVAGAVDPLSGSVASTRARLKLAAAGCGTSRRW